MQALGCRSGAIPPPERKRRGGQWSDAQFGARMRGEGPLAEAIRNLFVLSCRQAGVGRNCSPLRSAGRAERSGASSIEAGDVVQHVMTSLECNNHREPLATP
jgi:hypothetical protein